MIHVFPKEKAIGVKRTIVQQIFLSCIAVACAFATDGTWLLSEGAGRSDDPANWENGVEPSGGILHLPPPLGTAVLNVAGVMQLSGITCLSGGESSWGVKNRHRIGRAALGSAVRFVDPDGGVPVIHLPTDAKVAILELTVEVEGENGLKVTGGGNPAKIQRVEWYPTGNRLVGGFEISGGRLLVKDTDTLSDNVITLSGSGSRLDLWATSDAGLTLTQPIVLNSANSGLSYQHSGWLGTLWIASQISEAPNSNSNIVYAANTDDLTGGRFIVSGDNSYTGNTQIGGDLAGPVYVRVKSNNALGAGSSQVTFYSEYCALELEGGITISGKTITIRGNGNEGNGMLINQGGNNTWEGGVVLADHKPAIGVPAGQLTINGEISGTTTGGLVKKGEATLKLAGANKYSGGTLIEQGRIVAGSNTALGKGDVTIGSGAELLVDAGVQLSGMGKLAFADATSRIAFDLGSKVNGAPLSAGSQTGDETYTVNLTGTENLSAGQYVLMSVSGPRKATGFKLGEAAFGPHLAGALSWTGGVLTLRITPKS